MAGLDDEAAELEALEEEAQQARASPCRADAAVCADARCSCAFAPTSLLLAVQARDAADTLPDQVNALMAEVDAARKRTEAEKQGTAPFFL